MYSSWFPFPVLHIEPFDVMMTSERVKCYNLDTLYSYIKFHVLLKVNNSKCIITCKQFYFFQFGTALSIRNTGYISIRSRT